jgi:hypothetical protein
MPANQTQTQVHPGVAHFYAFPANVNVRGSEFDLVQMCAFCSHQFLQRYVDFESSDLSHVTKGHNHSQEPHLSPKISVEVLSVLRLDYLSCVLTIASTILVGRRCWEGWALAAVNSVIVCVIGFQTAQMGFIPANVFCLVMSTINLRAWRKPRAS